MTLAVIIATGRARGGAGPGPAAALPYPGGSAAPGDPDGPPTLLARLCDQLTTLNVPDVHVLGRPDLAPPLRAHGHFVTECADTAADLREIARLARLAWTDGRTLLLLPADLVTADEPLARLLDGAGATGATGQPGAGPPVAALTAPRGRAPARGPAPADRPYGTADARVAGRRIVAAGSADHAVAGPNALTLGALRIGAEQARAAADTAAELAGLVTPETRADAAELLLVGLVRSGTAVAAAPCGGAPCRRAADAAGVRAARSAIEDGDDAGRLAAAVKADDGFVATYAVSSYSPHIVRWAAGRDLTPAAVTGSSLALALLAAMWFSAGTRAGMLTGAVLLYLSFVLDCVDGQLARYTGRASVSGAWLDSVLDRVKEYAVYAGLAAGCAAAGGYVWALAAAALVLQVVRHMMDFSFHARTVPAPARARLTASLMAGDTPCPAVAAHRAPDGSFGLPDPAAPAGPGTPPVRRGGGRAAYWARKALVLPSGERFALIAVTAAVADARVTFIALLAWGAIAAAYTLAGRLDRAVPA
ncbi:CDP-alcohol phosphatidyltransferase family protein [Spirillospora sp. NPDC029432]|uniref:CDP-alcohol phosphatidyltransferase family protein n=1 Tax=Spirillospora sp. NPDC029432 TaxID=3154599 RepID=UPI003453A3D0